MVRFGQGVCNCVVSVESIETRETGLCVPLNCVLIAPAELTKADRDHPP
jgi:hypothetical protein